MLNVHLFRVVNPSNSQWLLFSMCSYNIYCLKPSVLDAKNAVLFKLQVYNPPAPRPLPFSKESMKSSRQHLRYLFTSASRVLKHFRHLGQCWCILLLSMVKIIINNKNEVNIVKRKRHRSQKTWEKVKKKQEMSIFTLLLDCLDQNIVLWPSWFRSNFLTPRLLFLLPSC